MNSLLEAGKALYEQAPKDKIVLCIDDTDSIFIGAWMHKCFGSKVVGYYENKSALYLKKGVDPREPFYMDIEVLVEGIHSIGNHINFPDVRTLELAHRKISRCINPNILRKHTRDNYFWKYPFSTLHLLTTFHPDPTQVFDLDNLFPMMSIADGSANVYCGKYRPNALDWVKSVFEGTCVEAWAKYLDEKITPNQLQIMNNFNRDCKNHASRAIASAKFYDRAVAFAFAQMGLEMPPDVFPKFEELEKYSLVETKYAMFSQVPANAFTEPSTVTVAIVAKDRVHMTRDVNGVFLLPS